MIMPFVVVLLVVCIVRLVSVGMKKELMIAVVLLSAAAHAQNLPNIRTIGQSSASCLDAAYKVLYVEVRVGVPKGHIVYIACDVEHYKLAVEQHGFTYAEAPYGFTDPRTVSTYVDAAQILRSDSATFNHDGRIFATGNFGQFVIAHEIGHLASSTPAEWQADAWAAQALKKYVKVGYEEYKLTAKK